MIHPLFDFFSPGMEGFQNIDCDISEPVEVHEEISDKIHSLLNTHLELDLLEAFERLFLLFSNSCMGLGQETLDHFLNDLKILLYFV